MWYQRFIFKVPPSLLRFSSVCTTGVVRRSTVLNKLFDTKVTSSHVVSSVANQRQIATSVRMLGKE